MSSKYTASIIWHDIWKQERLKLCRCQTVLVMPVTVLLLLWSFESVGGHGVFQQRIIMIWISRGARSTSVILFCPFEKCDHSQSFLCHDTLTALLIVRSVIGSTRLEWLMAYCICFPMSRWVTWNDRGLLIIGEDTLQFRIFHGKWFQVLFPLERKEPAISDRAIEHLSYEIVHVIGVVVRHRRPLNHELMLVTIVRLTCRLRL